MSDSLFGNSNSIFSDEIDDKDECFEESNKKNQTESFTDAIFRNKKIWNNWTTSQIQQRLPKRKI